VVLAAFEFLDLGQNIAGQVDRHVRQRPAQPLANLLLVLRVQKTEQECDRDRFHSRSLERGNESVDLFFRQRRHDRTVRADTLGDLESQSTRDQGRGRVLKKIIKVRARGASQLEHIPKTAGGDEGRARAAFLQDRVGHHGGRVRKVVHIGRRNPGSGAWRHQARREPLG